MESRSEATMGPTSIPAGIHKQGSSAIDRMVATDPQVDIAREKERQAEAQPDREPVSGLGLVSSEGVDDGGRGARSRHDYSNSSRRKETTFGDYVLGQTIGEGEFGKVRLGWKKDGSVQVAIKLLRRESLGNNPSRLPKIYREISILKELSHPNIVRLHEMAETDRHIWHCFGVCVWRRIVRLHPQPPVSKGQPCSSPICPTSFRRRLFAQEGNCSPRSQAGELNARSHGISSSPILDSQTRSTRPMNWGVREEDETTPAQCEGP
ncbi:uncharacterized protein PADG_06797 [Paracoccidioides brasiliensis Pb18]|uniref:Protein kinase domain-containing protein n=1 Tax=Paracoccidioides brasiliensis (strain Pb18) TaxID=502780 RepID=C1GHR1_PARBD|nr:uncharacterized protein PADG_06797 [Paracoccidioides brasiliensis Pb18]EEH50718.2 hypothetical protein PADG_06797 [Paracoccidioides brasiliensis Pb18]